VDDAVRWIVYLVVVSREREGKLLIVVSMSTAPSTWSIVIVGKHGQVVYAA